MKVRAAKCDNCNALVYSRARHDYRPCPCGAIAVDGGLDYLRVLWQPKKPAPETVEIEVDATAQQLYDDWNFSRDVYGIRATDD